MLTGATTTVASFDEQQLTPLQRIQRFLHAYPTTVPFVVLLLGTTKILSLDALSAVALGSTIVLEYAWHGGHFTRDHALVPLSWYIGFTAIFTNYLLRARLGR